MTEIMTFYSSHEVPILILALAVVTYLTRIGGYLVLARFDNIPAPVQAGLEAVPAAVITTLVVPPAIAAGPAEMITLVVAAIACFRLQPILVIVLGLAILVGLRSIGL